MLKTHWSIITLLWLFSTAGKGAESFNTNEVIHHSGGDELATDEGYLFLSLNTNTDISRLTIDGEGFGNKIRFNDISQGSNYALLKVKAGEYHWEHINIYVGLGAVRYHMKKDDFPFVVKPGVVNYPGVWFFNASWAGNLRTRMSLHNFNDLSFAKEYFNKYYQDLVNDVPFKYQGQILDPYAEFLDQAVKKAESKGPIPDLYYPFQEREKGPFTLYTKDTPTDLQDVMYPSMKAYFQYDSQSIRSVSPDGSFLLFSAVLDEVISIGLIGVENYDTYLLYQQKLPANARVSELQWIDQDSFFLTLSHEGTDRSFVAHLQFHEQTNTMNAQFIKFRYEGSLLDGLTDQNNQILFDAEWDGQRFKTNNNLYQVDVSDEKTIDKSFKKIYKKTKKLKRVIDWLVDKNGDVRAAISINPDEENTTMDYWYLPDAKSNDWLKIKADVSHDHVFWLMALSEDETYFLVLTNEFSDKYAIHKYATADGAHLGVYYEDPEHDINHLIFDDQSDQLMGYYYTENGFPQAHYFTELDDHLARAIDANSNLQLFQVSHITQQNKMLLFGYSTDSRGAWYMLNTESGKADKIFDYSPKYETLVKGEDHVIKIKAEDGIDLEGFLVMPELRAGEKAPLIVMPHGGPIGVRDFAHNNEMQHFLAAQGFATLKVNFRGSSGYGKNFQELGKKQWGEKIEQDIFTVTQQALKEHAINGQKICAMGGSYGGYSALMLTYLYPEIYQCAVSFAGVMDLPLLFTARDLSNDEILIEKMAEIVGDPKTELDQLIQKSPLYLLDEMKQPLLLFQGRNDTRVRIEHALRMQQLISLYGMDHEVVIFEDEGHSYSNENTVVLYLDKSLQFIKKHLNMPTN